MSVTPGALLLLAGLGLLLVACPTSSTRCDQEPLAFQVPEGVVACSTPETSDAPPEPGLTCLKLDCASSETDACRLDPSIGGEPFDAGTLADGGAVAVMCGTSVKQQADFKRCWLLRGCTLRKP